MEMLKCVIIPNAAKHILKHVGFVAAISVGVVSGVAGSANLRKVFWRSPPRHIRQRIYVSEQCVQQGRRHDNRPPFGGGKVRSGRKTKETGIYAKLRERTL